MVASTQRNLQRSSASSREEFSSVGNISTASVPIGRMSDTSPFFTYAAAQEPGYRFEYLQRMIHIGQVDWEFAVVQMLYLCIAPRKVYDFVEYRRQTKDTAARDDPGFMLLLVLVMILTTAPYAIALRLPFPTGFFLAVLFPPFLYLSMGLILAVTTYGIHRFSHYIRFYRPGTGLAHVHLPSLPGWADRLRSATGRGRYTSTAQLGGGLQRSSRHSGSWKPAIEFFYCFDVHSNAIFPSFLLCSIIQYILLPVLLQSKWPTLAACLSNTLYACAASCYCYISLLGYSSAGLFTTSATFLFPIVLIVICAVLLTFVRINMTRVSLTLFARLFAEPSVAYR